MGRPSSVKVQIRVSSNVVVICGEGPIRAVRRCFLRAVFAGHLRRARREGFEDPRCGAVNVVQRFGPALNLKVQFHALVLDGVYTAASPWARPIFHPAAELEDEDVAHMLQALRARFLRLQWPRRLRQDVRYEAAKNVRQSVRYRISVQ